MRTLKVKALDHHRNGISGLPFWVGVAEEKEDGEKREMLIIRFNKEIDKRTGQVACVALDLAELDKREIRFGWNSWRGDRYYIEMDAAIEKEEAKQ